MKSLYHDNEDHFTAKNMIATGSGRETRPPIGSWVAYGLGTENENLPAFVEIMPGAPKGTPAAFLPARYAGTAVLYGTLPFDAGVATTPDRLAGRRVLVVHGDQVGVPGDRADLTEPADVARVVRPDFDAL